MTDLSPKDIVAQLDRHIIGQADAKRSVAIALRNRWRRMRLTEELAKRSDAEKYSNDWSNRCR